jgi:hypothetical protein
LTDSFFYIANVTAGIANKVLPALNNAHASQRREYLEREDELYRRGNVDTRYRDWLEDMDARASGIGRRADGNLTLGYVTNDSCPGVGDDTPHLALPFFSAPHFISSTPASVSDDTPIDLVFVDYIEPRVLKILNSLQTSTNYTVSVPGQLPLTRSLHQCQSSDVASYSPFRVDEVLGLYAQAKWN